MEKRPDAEAAERRPIRVALADDAPAVRYSLGMLLKTFPDFEFLGEATSGEEAIDLCERTQPDVLLLDLVMPGIGGLAALREVRSRCPATQVVVVTSFVEDAHLRNALDQGAIGFLGKNATADEISKAIHAAHAGQAVLSPAAAQVLLRPQPKAAEPPQPDPRSRITLLPPTPRDAGLTVLPDPDDGPQNPA